jgi:hypothetical protein
MVPSFSGQRRLEALLGAAAAEVQVGSAGYRKKLGIALALPIKIVSHAIGLWPPLG